MKTIICLFAIVGLFAGVCATAAEPIRIDSLQRTEAVSFEKEILPILRQNCLACHSANEKQGDLVLESPRGMLQGGDAGPAIVPGRAAQSLLLTLASHSDDPIMPPEGNDVSAKNLTPAELGLIKLWIDQGAQGQDGIDALSPKQFQPLPAGIHPVQAIALTEDGQFLAAGRANQIHLYHVPTGQRITKLADTSLDTEQTTGIAHRDMVQSLVFSAQGDLLASGGFREVKLWRRPRDVQRLNLAIGAAATAVAVSPDQNVLAVAGADNQIRLLDANDGRLIRSLAGHSDTITSLRFSSDGRRLFSGSLDQTVRCWQLADGNLYSMIETPAGIWAIELVNLEQPTAAMPTVSQRLVTGHDDKIIRVWELSGTELGQLTGHSQPLTALVADSQRAFHLYSGSLDGSIRHWNIDTGKVVQQFNHGGPVTAIAVSPDGTRFASASENHTAKLFRSNGQPIAELRGDVRSETLQQRAQQLVNSVNSRLIIAKRLADAAEKDVPAKLEAEKKLADALTAANKDVAEKQVAVDKATEEKRAIEKAAIDASTAAKMALADREQAEMLAQLAAAETQIVQAKMTQIQSLLSRDPNNEQLKQLASATQQDLLTCQQQAQQMSEAIAAPTQKAQETATAANAAAKKVNEIQKPYSDRTNELKIARAQQNLLSQQHVLAAKELTLAQELVPIRKAALERAEKAKAEAEQQLAAAKETVRAAELPLRSIAFSPDGKVLVTAGDFPSLHSWDGTTGAALTAFAGHSQATRQVVFLDNHQLVSVSDDQSCRVWELNPAWELERTIGDGQDPGIIVHRATAVDFNRDASQLVVASGVPSRSGELQVFNVADATRVFHLPHAHEDVIYAARFSPEGKRVASAGADRYVRTFDVATGAPLRRFEGHTNYVLGLAWKSDGETIASAAADNTIKIWEAETGDQQRTISQQLVKPVTAVQFVGDTSNVLSSSGDRRVRLHNSDNGGLARNFSDVAAWLHCVATTPDSQIVAAGDAAGSITIWKGTNGQLLNQIPAE